MLLWRLTEFAQRFLLFFCFNPSDISKRNILTSNNFLRHAAKVRCRRVTPEPCFFFGSRFGKRVTFTNDPIATTMASLITSERNDFFLLQLLVSSGIIGIYTVWTSQEATGSKQEVRDCERAKQCARPWRVEYSGEISRRIVDVRKTNKRIQSPAL